MKRRYKRFLAGALAVMLLVPISPANTGTAYAKTAEKMQAGAEKKVICTVSFDARGGKKVKKTLTLTASEPYGKLPKTSREGYQFKGWYTKKSGGKRITAKSVFSGTADQVLYAHWKKTAAETPEETDTSEDAVQKPGGADAPGGEAPGENVPDAEQPDVPGAVSGALVPYSSNASIDYKKNGYGDFLVLKNFKAKYLYCQYDYDRFIGSSGKNVGCTATADAMLASIYMDKVFSPNDEGWISGVGATWTNSDVADGSKKYTVKQQCAAVYDYLQEGKPVLIRVIGHSVTAIGIRRGVNRETIAPGDILIADPADGKVKCADEMGYRVMTDANGWGLRIPKAVLASAKL